MGGLASRYTECLQCPTRLAVLARGRAPHAPCSLTNPVRSVLLQVFVPVESFASGKNALRGLGMNVNEEESDLVFRAAAPVEVDDEAFAKWVAEGAWLPPTLHNARGPCSLSALRGLHGKC